MIERLDAIGMGYILQGKTMGISIAVVQVEKTIYNRGFGFADSAGTVPVTNDNIFALASISKLIGSTMVMKLVEEGKLSLDNTLIELLPDFPNKQQAKKIKLRHLISHTSGIQDYANAIDSVYLATGIDPTKADFYKYFESHDLDFEPGANFNYSNSGFLLMAMIIESVTGNPFQMEVDRIINEPAGLDIKLIAETIANSKISTYFELHGDSIKPEALWPWIKGDGGLTTTALDLARFPLSWSDGTIISQSSFAEMCTPFILNDGLPSAYGLGVRTGIFEGEKVVGHTGGHHSGWAIMMYFPDLKLSVVVFVNTDKTPTDALTIAGDVSLAALRKEAPILKDIEVADSALDRFTGTYASFSNYYHKEMTVSMYLNESDGHLYQKRLDREEDGRRLYYMGHNAFAYDHYVMDRILFDTDDTGKVIAYKEYWNGLFKGGIFRKQNQ